MGVNNERGHQLVIYAKYPNGNNQYLHLDTITEKELTSSAQIPTHPLQDGNTMSDHMYRNPDTYRIRGSFGLFGMYRGDMSYSNKNVPGSNGKGDDRLTNIQEVFEYIKDNGILCDLMTLDYAENESVRFKIRYNMALKNISWTEHQVSMGYSFEFQEVICVRAKTYEVKEDEDLPNVYLPATQSLGMVMVTEQSSGELSPYAKIILRSLYENGYIQPGSIKYLAKTIKMGMLGGLQTVALMLVGAVVGTLAAAALIAFTSLGSILAVAGASAAAATAIFPVGTIIGAAVGVIAGTAILINKLIKRGNDAKKKERMFYLVSGLDKYITDNGDLDDAALQKAMNDGTVKVDPVQVDRLQIFLNDVKNQILNVNDKCTFYTLSSGPDDNTEREVVVMIGNQPFYINFIKTKSSPYWTAQVTTAGGMGEVPLDGSNGVLLNKFLPCTTLDEMDPYKTCMFKDASRAYEVYLYNPNLNSAINKTKEEQENVKKHLCSYQLVVSKGHVKDNVQSIYSIINKAIEDGGYV